MKEIIQKSLTESITLRKFFLKEYDKICEAAKLIINSYRKKGKVILFGNGGSAADAQHIAAEFVGRFKKERKALNAIALTTDTSILTAIGNDYEFGKIFSRQVEAICNRNDVVIGISTSGKSINVINGIKKAKELNAKTIALTGCDGGELKKIVDVCICIPSFSTPRIQEMHITIGHIICEIVEDKLF
jgi:D-sedoheptulose 7-phosphate isomerase